MSGQGSQQREQEEGRKRLIAEGKIVLYVEAPDYTRIGAFPLKLVREDTGETVCEGAKAIAADFDPNGSGGFSEVFLRAWENAP